MTAHRLSPVVSGRYLSAGSMLIFPYFLFGHSLLHTYDQSISMMSLGGVHDASLRVRSLHAVAEALPINRHEPDLAQLAPEPEDQPPRAACAA